MMNDYTVTIPFGTAAAVGGLLSLPLRVGFIRSFELQNKKLIFCNNHSRPCQVLKSTSITKYLCSAHAAPVNAISARLCWTSPGFHT